MIVIPADAHFLFILATLFVGLALTHDLVARGFVERAETVRIALAAVFVTFGVIVGLLI
jgi:hypothetical protein